MIIKRMVRGNVQIDLVFFIHILKMFFFFCLNNHILLPFINVYFVLHDYLISSYSSLIPCS